MREIRAAAPLIAALAAPAPARGPWLTAALAAGPAGPAHRDRPLAVLVEQHRQGRPDGAALLSLRRRGATTTVTLLGGAPGVGPVPAGRPTARLHARDDAVAAVLAQGVFDLVTGLPRPWRLELAGLPLGDPTLRHLGVLLTAARHPPGHATDRSRVLVDELDAVAAVERTRDPARLESWLPALLARAPRPERRFLRAAARVHAAIGELELAVVPGVDGRPPAAVLLTLVQGGDRWPWWGVSDVGGLRHELGAPRVSLTASAGLASGLTSGLSDRAWQVVGRLR